MKKFYIACLFGVALMFTSCSDQRAVQRTANAFLQSFFVENNFEAAKTLSTRMTHENISARALAFEWNPHSEEIRFTNFRINDIEVRQARAVVFYTLDNEVERRLNLRKTEGRWLVDMPETASFSPDFSLSPTHSRDGGFASAQSEFFRIGDAPKTENPDE